MLLRRIAAFTAFLDRQRSWLPLLLRIPVGCTFIVHGYGKVFERGILATASGYGERGIPLGGILGLLVPIAEFYGGILMIVGLGTRLWGFLQACTMLFAILFVHAGQGFRMRAQLVTRDGEQVASSQGWEWQLLLLAAALTLAIGGGGTISLDALLSRWRGRKLMAEATDRSLPRERVPGRAS